MRFRGVKIALLLLVLTSHFVSAQEDDIARKAVPAYTGLANDFAGVLKPEELSQLDRKLKAYEDSTSTQVVVVIEKSLNGRDQFDRSMDFARGWGVGQAGKNNGVVIYLAVEDRKLSIRTANATQGALTDGETGDIRRIMQPYLKAGKYFEALDIGSSAVMMALAGEFKAGGGKKKETVPGWGIIVVIIIFIVVIAVINNRGRYRGYRGAGPYWWGPGTWGGGGFGGFGGGSGGGGGWGGMGGGGGFDGGGSDGGW